MKPYNLILMRLQFFLLAGTIVSALGQAPVITSFSPASGPVGTTVIITGNNFNTTPSNNAVFFGAMRATVSVASSTQLTVTVPVGATYQNISMTNLSTGLTAYSVKPFIVTFVCGGVMNANSLGEVSLISNNSALARRSIVTADVDGDGAIDIISASGVGNKFSVFRNNNAGSISFSTPVHFNTGSNPNSIDVGDLNSDGRLDIVISNYGSRTISVYKNLSTVGNIVFELPITYETVEYPRNVAIADLDGDGKPDLVVGTYRTEYGKGSGIFVRRNLTTTSSISFGPKITFLTTGSMGHPSSVSVGDLDGDSKPDIAIVNAAGGNISVLRNTSVAGAISFSYDGRHLGVVVDVGIGDYPTSVAIGDFDGDNKNDLAVSSQGYNTSNPDPLRVSIFKNKSTVGSISFGPRLDISNLPNNHISITDMDGDGKIDLAIASGSSHGGAHPAYRFITLLKNISTSGSISFAAKVDYPMSSSAPDNISIGDLDGDGRPDLVFSDFESIKVLKNMVNNIVAGTIASNQTICVGGDPAAFAELSPPQGGTGMYEFQWQNSFDNLSFNDITGVTSRVYDAPAGITQNFYFRRVTSNIQDGVNCSAKSNTITVTINAVQGGAAVSNQTICSGGDPAPFTVTGALGTGSLSYQWVRSTSNSSFANINGATAATYDVSAGLTQSTYYGRKTISTLNGIACSNQSSSIYVTVKSNPAITITPSSPSICSGGSINISAIGASTYSWSPNTALSSTTGTTVSANPLTTTNYVVTGTDSSGCVGTKAFSVIVSNPVIITSLSGSATICPGRSYTYTANIQGGHQAGFTYQWIKPSNWTIQSQSNNTITFYVPSISPNYGPVRVTVTSGACSAQDGITTYPSGSCGTARKRPEGDVQDQNLNLILDGVTEPSVFPNPANSEIILALPYVTDEDVPVQVYSVLGSSSFTAIKKGTSYTKLNSTELAAGIYVVQIKTLEGIITRRVLVLH